MAFLFEKLLKLLLLYPKWLAIHFLLTNRGSSLPIQRHQRLFRLCQIVKLWNCPGLLDCRPARWSLCISSVPLCQHPTWWQSKHLCRHDQIFTSLLASRSYNLPIFTLTKAWTHFDSLRFLLKQQAKQQLSRICQLWLTPASAVCYGMACDPAGQVSSGPAKRVHVLMAAAQKADLLSRRVGHFRAVNRWGIQLSIIAPLLINSTAEIRVGQTYRPSPFGLLELIFGSIFELLSSYILMSAS